MNVDPGIDDTPDATRAAEAHRREYGVYLGRVPMPLEHCRYFKGKGSVAFEQDNMILRGVQSWPCWGITFIVWGALAAIYSLSLYMATGLALIPLLPSPIAFLIIWLGVKRARRKKVTAELGYRSCTAHAWRGGRFVMVKAADQMWIDLMPECNELAPFLEDARRHFGSNYYEEESSGTPNCVVDLEAPCQDDGDVLDTACGVVARVLDVPRGSLTKDYPLGVDISSGGPDAVRLRLELEQEFGLVISPEEVGSIRTVGQLAQHIEKVRQDDGAE